MGGTQGGFPRTGPSSSPIEYQREEKCLSELRERTTTNDKGTPKGGTKGKELQESMPVPLKLYTVEQRA